MRAKVEIGAVRHTLQLPPAEREVVLDVGGLLRVVGEALLWMVEEAEAVGPDAEHLLVPAHPLGPPVLEPAVVIAGFDEVLHLHQLELAQPEDEVPRCDLVAEGAALLGDAERDADAGRVEHVLEVHEHALGGLRPEVDLGCGIGDRAHVSREHEVEEPRLAELAAAVRAAPALQLVGPPATLALAHALHQRVDEVVDVAGGLPDLRVHDQRRLQTDHVVPQLDQVPPPELADVALERHAVGAIVVEPGEAAVDLARLEDESAPLAERGDLLHEVVAGDRHQWTVTAATD